jgi:hypothetical protein
VRFANKILSTESVGVSRGLLQSQREAYSFNDGVERTSDPIMGQIGGCPSNEFRPEL